ncbi:MAG: dTDP-4-dehydrorhamnose reductase [Ilumatobacteraceae bacterium]|nr:dTDP-4-dehydrorhamnose reductase [Ilumatobacteraceae bacterium]
MRILITGAAGQLGADLVADCTRHGDDVIGLDRAGLDVADRSAVLGTVTSLRPDVIVNAAAWTAVDACEGDPDRAFQVNALGPRWVREAAALVDAHLVQISTDYVFDGSLDRPYREWDEPDPATVYGASKLAGEREVGPEATIVRTSWVCGANGNNMVKTILRLVEEHPHLTFVDDQRGCPTFTADLAPMVRRLAVERRSGVHHVTNDGAVSWYEFVREIVAETGRDPSMVHPISTADLDPPRPAPRPANSVLDNAALRLAGVPLLRHHRDPLRELVAHLLS